MVAGSFAMSPNNFLLLLLKCSNICAFDFLSCWYSRIRAILSFLFLIPFVLYILANKATKLDNNSL